MPITVVRCSSTCNACVEAVDPVVVRTTQTHTGQAVPVLGVGWGSHCRDEVASGEWMSLESDSINVLKLTSVLLALQIWMTQLQERKLSQVMIMADNTSAITHIRNQGGHAPCLNMIAMEILDWSIQTDIYLSSRQILVKLNRRVDLLSQQGIMATEWTLNTIVFEALCKVWPRPFLNLMATRENAVCVTGSGRETSSSGLILCDTRRVGGLCLPSQRLDSHPSRESGSSSGGSNMHPAQMDQSAWVPCAIGAPDKRPPGSSSLLSPSPDARVDDFPPVTEALQPSRLQTIRKHLSSASPLTPVTRDMLRAIKLEDTADTSRWYPSGISAWFYGC